MPSESKVCSARKCLIKILRRSMRKRRLKGSEDSSAPGDHPENLQEESGRSSARGLERLEHPSNPCPSTTSGAEAILTLGGRADMPSTENIVRKAPHQAEPSGTLRAEESPPASASNAGRPRPSPLWRRAEKGATRSPPPPLRGDNFATNRIFPCPETPAANHCRSTEGLTERTARSRFTSHLETISESSQSLSCGPNTLADLHQPSLHPDRLCSLSSTDVRQSHCYIRQLVHQKQYRFGDSSPSLQTRTAPPTKTQSLGSFYQSLQVLPTSTSGRKHARPSTSSAVGSAFSGSEDGGHGRYWQGLAGKHSVKAAEHEARQGIPEGWRMETDKCQRTDSNQTMVTNSLTMTEKSSLPPTQIPIDAAHGSQVLRKDVGTSPHARQTDECGVGLQKLQDPWVPQQNPRTRLLLQYLAQRRAWDSTATIRINRQVHAATAPREDIRHKLQKSRSTAVLSGEDAESGCSTELWAFSDSYKEHLKEAQARVLQATSFQRRDLEPLGPDGSKIRIYSARVRGRRSLHLVKRTHSFSEPNKMDMVGMEPQSGCPPYLERRKTPEAKPYFSRPVVKFTTGSNTDKELPETSNHPAGTADPVRLNPRQDPHRLGTFAEYQATWKEHRKSLEVHTQPKSHSVENMVESGAEENPVHERSRSSPSTDSCAQSVPSLRMERQPGQHILHSRPRAAESHHRPQTTTSAQELRPPSAAYGEIFKETSEREVREAEVEEEALRREALREEEQEVRPSPSCSLVTCSSYYSTSAPKAELLIKLKDLQQEQEEKEEQEEEEQLAAQKYELMCSLTRKLQVLREARDSLQEDVEENEALGRRLEGDVRRCCDSAHLHRFCMLVGDLDKVVRLLLSLSARLARVDHALSSLEERAPPEEKQSLTEKRKLLLRQHDDARELQEDLERRERLLSAVMAARLDADGLDDYRHFVKMKAGLIVERRRLEDRIELGEEQLACLVDSLPPERRPAPSSGWDSLQQ